MSRVNRILLWIVGVLIVVFIALAVWLVFLPKSSWYAVYLRTGDLYFGKMMKFPSFGLKNVYTLQVTGDDQNPIRVQKFGDVFWGPQDWVKINRDEVVWYTKLSEQGQLATLLTTNPNLIPQQMPQAGFPGIGEQQQQLPPEAGIQQ